MSSFIENFIETLFAAEENKKLPVWSDIVMEGLTQ